MEENIERNSVIKKRLERMAEMAGKRFKYIEKHGSNIDKDLYIRIRGEDFRAVSLNDNTPLFGFKQNGSKNIDTIIRNFKNDDKPKENKKLSIPERRIQCWLIKNALANNNDLKSVLSLKSDMYDELTFALDEVSLGDKNHAPIIRCDILAVGTKNNVSFPVLIELKSIRNQKTLIDQLNDFCKEINDFSAEFKLLLEKCFGRQIDITHMKKMVIWPNITKGKEDTIEKYHTNCIDIIEYDWDHGKDISNVRFTFIPYPRG